MSNVIEETSLELLNSLEDTLIYAKKLNKKAEFGLALNYFINLEVQFEQQAKHEQVMECLSGICQSLGNLGRVNEIEAYLST